MVKYVVNYDYSRNGHFMPWADINSEEDMLSQFFALTSTADTATKIDAVALALGIALIVMGIFLVIAVLLQPSKEEKGLSGTISGAAETFFSKTKGNTWEKLLNKLTMVIGIIFAILVIVMYIYVS